MLNWWQQHRLSLRVLVWCAAIVPACLTAGLIYKYAVDVPLADEWMTARHFERLAQGTLKFRHLYEQANEYRQLFPYLFFLGLGRLTKWDVRYEMLASFLLACLISYNIYRLGRLTLDHIGRRQRLLLYVCANLLIFSPAQYDNWLQGQQLIFFIPVVCLTTGLRVALSARLSDGAKFLLCAGLAVLSTFSAANGLLCWLLLWPALVWPATRTHLGRRRWWLIVWLAGLALCVVFYFYDYHKPPPSPALSAAFVNPVRALLYFLCVLGAPLSFDKLPVAAAVGALCLVLFVWSARRLRPILTEADAARPSLVWLTLGAYSLLTAGLLTFGRAGFGVAQSLSSRYTTYTLYLPVALVHLLPFILDHARAKKLAIARLGLWLAGALLVAQVLIYPLSVRWMSDHRSARLQLKACVELVNVVSDVCPERIGQPEPTFRRLANTLDALGYLRPGLVRGSSAQDFAAPAAFAPESYGSFLSLVRGPDDLYTASGRALLPHRGEPADTVLLAYEAADGSAHVFAIADMAQHRDIVSVLLRRGAYKDAHWQKTFDARGLPPPPLKLSAWAFDAYAGRAYKIAGTQIIAPPAPR